MTDSQTFSAEQASDPGTSPQDMARIAAERPDLWVALAANPSLYPDLREWLGRIDDPAVKEALVASAQQSAPAQQSVPAPVPQPSVRSASGLAETGPSDVVGRPVGDSAPPPPAAPVPAAPAPVSIATPPPPRMHGRRPSTRTWGVIAAVLAAVLVVGGGGFAVYSHLTQRGASSPEAVMDAVSQAVLDKDPITMFKMASPAEIDPVVSSSDEIRKSGGDSSGRSSKADPDALLSEDAINEYLGAIDVRSSRMSYSVDQKSDDLAIATVSSWHLDASINQSMTETLRARYSSAKGTSLNANEEDFFSDLDFSDASYNGDVAESFSDSIPLEIVLMREDGRWYVSPLMTVSQWSYRDRAQSDGDVREPDYDADFTSVKGASTPEKAVENLTTAALDARRPSELFSTDVASMLSLAERRLVMVYGPTMIGDDEDFVERGSKAAKIDWGLTSTDVGDDRAVVHPGHSTITLNPGDDYEETTLAFDDNTVKVTTSAAENNTATADFTRELANPDRLGVVVEKSDGGWHVSPTGTLTNIFSLRPSENALDDLSHAVYDVGLFSSSKDADDFAESVTQSVALATPVLVGFDVADQLQDLEWRGHYRSYSRYGSSSY